MMDKDAGFPLRTTNGNLPQVSKTDDADSRFVNSVISHYGNTTGKSTQSNVPLEADK